MLHVVKVYQYEGDIISITQTPGGAEAEGNKNDITRVNGISSIYIHNHLPVIKPSASAAICDMIGYFCEIH